MSEPKRTWLTGDEFQSGIRTVPERKPSHAGSKPQPVTPSNPPVIYELKPRAKYVPNKLDTSDYPGQVVYRRSVIEQALPR